MADIALLDSGNFEIERQVQHPLLHGEVTAIDVYDLPRVDLASCVGLLVPASVDQELLYQERRKIREFLEHGKVLVFCGHLFRPWLPGGSPFVPRAVRSFRDYTVSVVAPHPIFEGVRSEDLTFRRGVAGFFARGHHPPPPGAEVLVAFASGEPVVYVDRQSTRGTILVHSGNDLWGLAWETTTAQRVVPRLFRWVREEERGLEDRRRRA